MPPCSPHTFQLPSVQCGTGAADGASRFAHAVQFPYIEAP